MIKKYGKTKDDKTSEDMLRSRQIVNEVLNFGVSEYQKIHIMKLLALELEDNEDMKKIINTLNLILENNNSDENKLITT